ncbi:MAG: hypothetical protein Q4B99_03635 [Clostridia bacterium]|nr:hypothetical protein [Clostridia bacterium]
MSQKTKRDAPEAALVLSTLTELCLDDAQKTADRISAAKLLLDYIARVEKTDDAGVLKVVFEDEAPDYIGC